MDKLMKINEVATKYDTTKRTLRYYEEIGLLKSRRDDFSNYRYYDDDALKRLEQILLLRGIDFNLDEVREILLSNNDETINRIFNNKLIKIQDDINSLIYFRKVVSSIINIRKEQGRDQINFQEILKEQVYLNKKLGRMIEMSQYVGDIIIIEFGINICTIGEEIIREVKKLRVELEDKYKKEIPLIRIRDKSELSSNEYRIVIKDIIVENENLENITNDDKTSKIIDALRKALIRNMENINI